MGRKRDFRFFEGWARHNGMMPAMRVTDVTINGKHVGDILLADSGDLLSHAAYPSDEHRMVGFYRTGFAIDRPGDKTWIASFNDYPPDSFSDFSQGSRKDQRLKDALRYAIAALEQTHQAGLYNGNDRKIAH